MTIYILKLNHITMKMCRTNLSTDDELCGRGGLLRGLTLGPASVTTWNFMAAFPCRHVCSIDCISFMHVLLCGPIGGVTGS